MAIVLNLFPARIQFVNPDGTLTLQAYRALQTLMVRVGGPIGPSISDLDEQQYADAGIEETRALLFGVANDAGSLPPAQMLSVDDQLSPSIQSQQQVDQLQTELNELRELVAKLETEINGIKQGAEL